jgi:APA family basic amino acid/polyamine antiporter
MSVITAIYCVMALVLSMMQPYTAIDRSAAYSVAFASVGMHWAQYVVALGALKGMTTPERWQGYVVLVPAWAAGTLGIQLLVPAARAPKVWGVPLVPWLPSLSIATNLFLMGSLGKDAFIRFGVCTAVMLVYYVLVGLHATYDVAHGACAGEEDADGEKKVVAAADVEKADAAGGVI